MFLYPAWKGESSLLWCHPCHLCFGAGTRQICVCVTWHWPPCHTSDWDKETMGSANRPQAPVRRDGIIRNCVASLEIVLQLSHTHLLFGQRSNSCGSTFQTRCPSLAFPFPPFAQQIHHNTVNQTVGARNKWKWHPMYPSGFFQVTSGQIPTDYQHLHCSVACHSRETAVLESFLNPLCCLKKHGKAMKS